MSSLRSRDDDGAIRVMDAAYWRKGCSSLGRLRFAVLLGIEGGGRGPERHCLIDVKEAIAAAAPRNADTAMPRGNADRVVEGARHLARTGAVGCWPRACWTARCSSGNCCRRTSSSRLRRSPATRRWRSRAISPPCRPRPRAPEKAWCKELDRRRGDALDAPSWLWCSIVDLVGTHEAAYLEHCRRYALAAAA